MEKIDMVLSRDAMYRLIWLDYFDRPKSERTQCFIYNYLKKNKNRRCSRLSSDIAALTEYGKQKRYDKYTLLKSAQLAYKNKVSDRDFFVRILADSVGAKVPDFAEKSDEELNEAAENQAEKLLFGCIADFFQNSGYRFKKKDSAVRTGKKKDETEKKFEEEEYDKVEAKYTRKQGGYISDLDMWADFYLYEKSRGRTVTDSLGGIIINNEYIEKCEKLYSELLAENQTDVFVPLCFDAKSGAGIYIVGREKIMNKKSIPVDKPCCIFVSCFFYVDCCDYANEELLLSMQFTKVENVRNAFDVFQKSGTSFFRHYPDENDSLPAEADSCFNVFFDKTAPDRTKRLAEKLLERENADLARNKPLKHRKPVDL